MFEKLAEDIAYMAQIKLATLVEQMEKDAGRTFSRPTQRLANQLYKGALPIHPSNAAKLKQVDRVQEMLGQDPLMLKQFISENIADKAKNFYKINPDNNFDSVLKALLFNKHKKNYLPKVRDRIADNIAHGFNARAAVDDAKVMLVNPKGDRPFEMDNLHLYDEMKKYMNI